MEIKMDRMAIIVSAVVGSLGALSAILGFAAEGEQASNRSAAGLGICAALFLLVAQSTVSAVTVVGYCKYRPTLSETKQILVIVCGVVSWIAAAIASVLSLFGSAWNTSGIYAGAAVLTVAATALGITCFVMMRKQPAGADERSKPGEKPTPAGIATGQPHFPPPGVAGEQIQTSGYGSQAPNQQSPPPQEHEQV